MTETLLVFSLLCLTFNYIGYPISLAIIGMFSKINKNYTDILPRVDFMIAAYNEEEFIAEKIKNTLELDYPKDLMNIIIVSDGSQDKTDQIVRSFKDSRVKLFRVEGRQGKTEARNIAVAASQAEIIVFSDATAIYEKDALRKIMRHFGDETVGMVSGNLKYQNQQQTGIGFATTLYWRYERLIKKHQARLWTLTGSVGCINAFRRLDYTPLPAHIIEDFTEPLMFILKGKRVVFEEEAIAYERTTSKPSQELVMRSRVIKGGLQGMWFARQLLNPFLHPLPCYQLIGHKILRWLGPFLLLTLFSSNAVLWWEDYFWFYHYLFMAQCLFYGLATLGLVLDFLGKRIGILSFPMYFLVANTAAALAWRDAFLHRRLATWETNTY